jgi:DNA-binding MarR family transcriptional regulator
MYETWHLAAAYVGGTAAGLMVFKTYVKESIIENVLDSLVDQGYVKSYTDAEGTIQFMKVVEIERETEILNELMNRIDEYEEGKNEKDDTP